MAIDLPCRKDIDLPEFAQHFFESIICQRGIPDNVIADRGTQFTSRFWTQVCSHLSTDNWLSTAFHPQIEGQTEGQNQTMEQFSRAFCTFKQGNWVELLLLAEFAYNNAGHASTRMTPFWVYYHYHPVMQFKAPKQPSSLKLDFHADTSVAGLEETHQTLCKNLQEAQARQTKYTDGKEVVVKIGDQVGLSTRHFQTTRPSKMREYTWTGPYTQSKVINHNAFKLDLP